jgi:molybdate transport system substrate-binding protein
MTLPPPTELHVAAAANLSTLFSQIEAAYGKKSKARLIPSFGSTAQLTKQIQSGAPFDIFLAADLEHPTQLTSEGLAKQPRPYAKGRLVLWAPHHPQIRSLQDLAAPSVRTIAIANPDLAPYGKASIEALERAGLWPKVKPRVVYAQNISAAMTYADSGNAEVALTAFSLVASKAPDAPLVPEDSYAPITQAFCVLNRSSQTKAAEAFATFLLGPEGRALFTQNGYSAP